MPRNPDRGEFWLVDLGLAAKGDSPLFLLLVEDTQHALAVRTPGAGGGAGQGSGQALGAADGAVACREPLRGLPQDGADQGGFVADGASQADSYRVRIDDSQAVDLDLT